MRKGERTRAAIIDAALTLFLRKGVHGVLFQEIGDAVGIANPTVYKHFATKEDLLVACAQVSIARARDYVDAAIDPDLRAPERLRAYVLANLRWVEDLEREAYILLAMYYHGKTHAGLRDIHREVDERSAARIATHLIQGQHEGAWQLKSPRALARIIHSLLAGEMIKALRDGSRIESAEQRAREAWSAVRRLVQGPSETSR